MGSLLHFSFSGSEEGLFENKIYVTKSEMKGNERKNQYLGFLLSLYTIYNNVNSAIPTPIISHHNCSFHQDVSVGGRVGSGVISGVGVGDVGTV